MGVILAKFRVRNGYCFCLRQRLIWFICERFILITQNDKLYSEAGFLVYSDKKNNFLLSMLLLLFDS